MANNTRIVPVPDRCRTVHGVYSSTASTADAGIEAPPAVLLRHFGASEADLARLADRPHSRAVVTDVPVAEAADALLEARLRALDLAGTDGVVVDLAVPRIVTHDAGAADLSVAAQWVAFELDADRLRSRGLEAFGLPEMVVDVADPGSTAAVLAIVTGLAHRLIAEWPANDPVGPASVTLRDVARGFGDPAADDAPVVPALDLLVSYASGELLVTLLDDPTTLFPR